MSRRLALIIGNSEYEDTRLARLATPNADVRDLAEVLRDPAVGGFDEVGTLVNQPAPVVSRAIARLFKEKSPDDLVVMYFSGHGVLDDQGRLYLAVKDTEHSLLNATAIPAAFVTDEMDRSRSRRQVLILDCCHSGAVARGTKGAPGQSVGTRAAFEGTGYGRVVLTATDSTQYAWEQDQVIGEAENSVFTHYLIRGLKTGAADADADGAITLDELYDYVYEQVRGATPRQTPSKFSSKEQGNLLIARNPNPAVIPAQLPAELLQALESPLMGVREGAVRELGGLLHGSHRGLAQAAYDRLKRIAEHDDSRRVSALAGQTLAEHAQAQSAKEQARAAAERAEAEKLAAQKSERERLERERAAAERAEAEKLAAQKSERERLERERAAAERAAQERQARESEEQARRAREAEEAERRNQQAESVAGVPGRPPAEAEAARPAPQLNETPPAEKTQPGTHRAAQLRPIPASTTPAVQSGLPALVRGMWLPVLLTTVGWGLGWRIAESTYFPIPSDIYVGGTKIGYVINQFLSWLIAGAVGGVLVGYGIHQAGQPLRGHHIVAVAAGWTGAAGMLPILIQLISASSAVLAGVAGLAGGLFTGLLLMRVRSSLQATGVGLIAAGWGLAWAIGYAVLEALGSAVDWAVAWTIAGLLVGALGGAVMAWQLVRARER